MGEAKEKRLAEIAALIKKARKFKLIDSGWVICFAPEELATVYNGIGPEWLPYSLREKLTKYLAVFAPACLIHDFHYWIGDGTLKDFNYANDTLEANCRKCINAETKWYQFLRRAAGYYAAHLMAEACRRYGWSAYRTGRMNDEEVRVPSSSSREEDKIPSSNSNSQLQLKSLALFAFFAVSILFTGCYRSIELVREGEYSLTYTAVGLKTDVSKIEAEKMTNGTVRVVVEGVATDVSERNAKIIESSGTAVGNIAEKVVEGVK
jgi:hypothetical protein